RVRKDVGDLIRACDALHRYPIGWKAADILAIEQDAARSRAQHSGQAIEEGALSGAVRPDDRADLFAVDLKTDVVDRGETAKFARQPFRAQHGGFGANPDPRRGWRVDSGVRRHLRRGEFAGRREESLVAGDRLDDAVLAVFDVEDDLQRKRLVIFLAEQLVSGREVVTQFHLQALKRLDELHRVFAAAEFRQFHADLERVHRLVVRLDVAIRQRPRWVDLRQPRFGFVEEFLVL